MHNQNTQDIKNKKPSQHMNKFKGHNNAAKPAKNNKSDYKTNSAHQSLDDQDIGAQTAEAGFTDFDVAAEDAHGLNTDNAHPTIPSNKAYKDLKNFNNLIEGKISIDGFLKKKLDEGVTFIPLGGVNQIGLNMNLYHYKGTWILVDCGSGFTNKPGIDILVPSTDFIVKNNIKISALFITHLHEDHVGGLVYFFRTTGSECVVYTTKLTYHFLKFKLERAKLQHKIRVEFVESTESLDTKTAHSYIEIDNFVVRPVELPHSTPGMNAYLISTKSNQPISIFHTGDWRFDEKPIIGNASNDHLLAQIGQRGVNAIVCDSTNVFNPHSASYEGDLANSLSDIIGKSSGTIFVTTFGSNFGRVISIFNAAKAHDKGVLVLGTSLDTIMKSARAAGLTTPECKVLTADNPEEIKRYINSNKLLVIATGCQGERLAAMSKIARGEMLIGAGFKISLRTDDTVIFSSKRIPGNEYKLEELYNLLYMRHAKVITENDHFVHASGHCAQPELLKMFQLLTGEAKPNLNRYVIPVHGSLINTNKSCELVASWSNTGKLKDVKSLRIRDGSVVSITHKECKAVDHIRAEPICVNGHQYISMDSNLMQTREAMQNGAVIVSVYLYKSKLAGFGVACPGYLDHDDSGEVIAEIEEKIKTLIERKKLKYERLQTLMPILNRDIKMIVSSVSYTYISSHGKMPHIEIMYLQSFNEIERDGPTKIERSTVEASNDSAGFLRQYNRKPRPSNFGERYKNNGQDKDRSFAADKRQHDGNRDSSSNHRPVHKANGNFNRENDIDNSGNKSSPRNDANKTEQYTIGGYVARRPERRIRPQN